ncbi:MAG: hypothetical protein ABSC34_02505 [Acidimicrobiales bacterium]|jgi:hypothetical protein
MSARKTLLIGLALIVGLSIGPATLASGGTALTKAQFIAKANALCTDAANSFAPEVKQLKGETMTPQLIAKFVAELLPVVQAQIDKTKELVAPKTEQSKVATMLSTDQKEWNALKANPQLMGANGGKTSPFVTADGLARKLGLLGAPGSGVCSK